MKPADYCVDRAHNAGFDHLYRFLFKTDDQHLACLATRALESQFDELIEESTQPEVAVTQLAWWRDEFARLRTGEPRHPITKTLTATKHAAIFDDALADSWIAGVQSEVENPVPADDADWRTRLGQRHAESDKAFAQILQADPARSLSDFTAARAMARQYLALGRLVRNGFLALPQATLEAAGIAPASILQRDSHDDLRPILQSVAEESATRLQAAMDSIRGEDTAGLAGLFATGEVQLALLGLVKEKPEDVLVQQTRLTAVRQVLIARRARGRAKRNARN